VHEAGKARIFSQLFLNEEFTEVNSRLLKDKLTIAKKSGLERLMIWSVEPRFLRPVVSICRGAGVSPHLWYPLLADTPVNFDTSAFEVTGIIERSESEILDYQKAGGEEFKFLCPNRVGEAPAFLDRFEEIINLADFDGVFLDRIRFPSPANGIGEMLTCFCDTCKVKSHGLVSDFEKTFCAFIEELNTERISSEVLRTITEFRKTSTGFREFRISSVLNLLSEYSRKAREKGLEVGVDLFSPSLADFVSQDYGQISREVDWIKPMIYCKTMGPAGLPMELLSLAKTLMKLVPEFSEKEALKIISEFVGLAIPGSFDELTADGIDQSNFSLELDKIVRMSLSPSVKVFPGFEAVEIPPVCSIGTHEVKNYVETTLEKGYYGFVLSWDIRHIQDSTLEYVGDLIESR